MAFIYDFFFKLVASFKDIYYRGLSPAIYFYIFTAFKINIKVKFVSLHSFSFENENFLQHMANFNGIPDLQSIFFRSTTFKMYRQIFPVQ